MELKAYSDNCDSAFNASKSNFRQVSHVKFITELVFELVAHMLPASPRAKNMIQYILRLLGSRISPISIQGKFTIMNLMKTHRSMVDIRRLEHFCNRFKDFPIQLLVQQDDSFEDNSSSLPFQTDLHESLLYLLYRIRTLRLSSSRLSSTNFLSSFCTSTLLEPDIQSDHLFRSPTSPSSSKKKTSAPNKSRSILPWTSEQQLIHELIFVFQGIDGEYIKYNFDNDRYELSTACRVSPSQYILLTRLSEMGWLFRRIQKYLKRTQSIPDEAIKFGLIEQSFREGISEELLQYHKMIAVLQAQVEDEKKSSGTNSEMNLVKLALWTAEPFRRLKWLAAVIESKLASFPDGDDIGDVFLEETTARLTQLRQMRSHGASYPQSLRKILEIFTSRPVLTMIQNWMYQGVLNDPFNEFFIIKNDLTTLMRTLGKGDIESLKPDDPHDWDWDKQYLLVHARIPPFICQKIALEILSIGKGVNFMRQCCGDVTWINTSMAKFLQSDSNCRAIHIDQLLQPIDRLYKIVNDRLVSLMLDKFHLMEHMEAIRGYVFLGQGDLVQTLTDSLAHELNLPPGRQYRHNFLPAVDAAFKTSSASSWPAYLQECCDILIRTSKNLAPERPSSSYYNPKDGWDTVELFYKLSSPISAVIGNKSLLQQYRLVFRFLWRLKRTEHILVNTWRVLTNCSKQLLTIVPEISGLLHLCHMTRHEMVCFSNNIQYYFMCEVLESSWQTLQQKVYSSLSLDEIVNSYNFYISTIVKAIFFDYTSVSHPKNTDSKDANTTQKTLSSMILEISDVIREFCHQCEMLYSVSCEIASFSNPEFRENLEHTDRYKWGVTGEDEAVIQDFKEHLEKILTVELNTVIDKYKQVFRQFLTTLSYEVKKGNNAHLRYLFQRINYNSYYTLESRRNQFASTISPTVCSTTISNSMFDAIKGDSPLNAKINSATAETPKNP